MFLASSLAPETSGRKYFQAPFVGSWALVCRGASSWEGKYNPLLPGLPTKDRASGMNLLAYSQDLPISPPPVIWKNEVASSCVLEVRTETMIGDFLPALTYPRKGEADSRRSVPLQEHHWASNVKRQESHPGQLPSPRVFPQA